MQAPRYSNEQLDRCCHLFSRQRGEVRRGTRRAESLTRYLQRRGRTRVESLVDGAGREVADGGGHHGLRAAVQAPELLRGRVEAVKTLGAVGLFLTGILSASCNVRPPEQAEKPVLPEVEVRLGQSVSELKGKTWPKA